MFAKMNLGSSMEKMEEVPREEWMERLAGVHPTRTDMNKLIMNYLVTGEMIINSVIRGSQRGIDGEIGRCSTYKDR